MHGSAKPKCHTIPTIPPTEKRRKGLRRAPDLLTWAKSKSHRDFLLDFSSRRQFFGQPPEPRSPAAAQLSESHGTYSGTIGEPIGLGAGLASELSMLSTPQYS